MASGRTRSIQDAANASACGPRLAIALKPSSGLGNFLTLVNDFIRGF